MAEIRVNSQVLRDASSKIKSEHGNFVDLSNEIRQGLSSLSGTWEGDAFNSFMEQLNSLQPSLESYGRVINEYAQFLDTTAQQYDETEAQAQNETSNLQNTLFK